MIENAPFRELIPHGRRRIIDEESCKALKYDVLIFESMLPIHKILTLLDPAEKVSTDVVEHADLAETPLEKPFFQFFDRHVPPRQQALNHETSPRTLNQFPRSRTIRERVQYEWRHFIAAIAFYSHSGVQIFLSATDYLSFRTYAQVGHVDEGIARAYNGNTWPRRNSTSPPKSRVGEVILYDRAISALPT